MRLEITYCEAQHRHDPELRRIAAEGLRVCDGCRVGMQRDLEAIPELWSDLQSGVVRLIGGLGRTNSIVSGTRSVGVVYDAAALNCAEQMSRDLEYFCREILGVPESVAVLAAKRLRVESDRVAGHELGPMVREVCRSLVGSAYAILDPAGRPKEIGACPQVLDLESGLTRCTGTLYLRGEGRRAEMYCQLCGVRVPLKAWRHYISNHMKLITETVHPKGDLL